MAKNVFLSVDRTRPFQPGASSTPYQIFENIEMQTMQDEQSGLPDSSYALLRSFIHQDDKPAILESKKEIIKKEFPTVDFGKLDPINFSKKR